MPLKILKCVGPDGSRVRDAVKQLARLYARLLFSAIESGSQSDPQTCLNKAIVEMGNAPNISRRISWGSSNMLLGSDAKVRF